MTFLMPGIRKFQRLGAEGLSTGGQAGEWRRLEMYVLRSGARGWP